MIFVVFPVVCLKRCLVSPLRGEGQPFGSVWRETIIISQEGKTLRERARAKKKQYNRRGSLFRGAVCIHQCHSDGRSFLLTQPMAKLETFGITCLVGKI